jgi:hypothetical protein
VLLRDIRLAGLHFSEPNAHFPIQRASPSEEPSGEMSGRSDCRYGIQSKEAHMQKIGPCLRFDRQAEEAADFYVSIFPNKLDIAALQRAYDNT